MGGREFLALRGTAHRAVLAEMRDVVRRCSGVGRVELVAMMTLPAFMWRSAARDNRKYE